MESSTEKGAPRKSGWLDRKVFTGEFEDIWIDVGLFGAGLLLAYFLAFTPV
jgi:hypothetical protein